MHGMQMRNIGASEACEQVAYRNATQVSFARVKHRPTEARHYSVPHGIFYVGADGLYLASVYEASTEAVQGIFLEKYKPRANPDVGWPPDSLGGERNFRHSKMRPTNGG